MLAVLFHAPISTLEGFLLTSLVVAGSITVKWKEDYFIAASKTSVEHGGMSPQKADDRGVERDKTNVTTVTVTSATNYAPIKFGQRYTCNASWLDSDAGSDPSAPEDGFLFKNKDTPAAAVIAKKINGKTTPYYISPVLLPPAGRLGGSKLIPTPTVAVWFQMDVDNGTMIESDNSDLYIIKLKGPSAKATFDKDGFWGPGKNLDD